MEENEVVVVVKGGVLQEAYSKNKDIKITLVDYDNINAGDDLYTKEELKELESFMIPENHIF